MSNIKYKFLIFPLVFLIFSFLYFILPPNDVRAATNIDSTYHWAWNDVIGWIDFYSTSNVTVTSTQVTGYASSSVGYIAFDCVTSPNGNICGTSNFKVANDGSGNLSGWAWNDAIGWISFDSATASSSYIYQVSINPTSGDFSGWAWNDMIGWISFNCLDTNSCGTSNYKVKTANTGWSGNAASGTLVSSIFDTQVASGTAINTIMWQGSQPSGTEVKFQIASGNSTTTWSYLGPDGTSNTYYAPLGPNLPVQINLAQHNNKRYFRYKIVLYSNSSQTVSPKVDDVIINWSP